MHRTDGPGATVDKKFTEGDPVGGVPATVVTAAWMNDVQEELVSILAAAGITPVKGTQDQVLKAIRTISTGAVGASVNARMSITTANANATFTADEVIVKSALGGLAWLLSGFSKAINLATTGAGGMDTGTAPVSGFVAIYAIYNPTTGVSALLATNATAAVAPNTYGGANMPAGYTASALVAVMGTNGSSQFRPGQLRGRIVTIPLITVLTSSSTAGFASFSLAAAIPQNAISIGGEMLLSSTVSSSLGLSIAADPLTTGQQNMSGNGLTVVGNFRIENITNQQTAYWSASSTAGTPSFSVAISSYGF